MDLLLMLLFRLYPIIFGSCENEAVLLYKGLMAQQQVEFSWVEQWHTNYCYRSYDGDLSRPNRLLGNDFNLFHQGHWHPHRYGTEADEQDAVVLFDKNGRYHPHRYGTEVDATDPVIDPATHPTTAGVLPQMPNPEAIVVEQIKETKERMNQCTDAAVEAFQFAQDTAVLESQYDSGKTGCTKIHFDFNINLMIEKRFYKFRSSCTSPFCDMFELDAKLGPVWENYNNNKIAIAENFHQHIQAEVNSAETRLTAAYNKRLRELVAG